MKQAAPQLQSSKLALQQTQTEPPKTVKKQGQTHPPSNEMDFGFYQTHKT